MTILENLRALAAKRTPGRWYATHSGWCKGDDLKEKIWTVGPRPDRCNWETDSGQDGYGIFREDAAFIAAAANHIDRILDVVDSCGAFCERFMQGDVHDINIQPMLRALAALEAPEESK